MYRKTTSSVPEKKNKKILKRYIFHHFPKYRLLGLKLLWKQRRIRAKDWVRMLLSDIFTYLYFFRSKILLCFVILRLIFYDELNYRFVKYDIYITIISLFSNIAQ